MSSSNHSSTAGDTVYPIGAGLAAAVAVLFLAVLLILIWCTCLRCVSYQSTTNLSSRREKKQYAYRRNSNTRVIPVQDGEKGVSFPPRLVSLKEQQISLSNSKTAVTKENDSKNIVERMESVMDDAVRIDLHHQQEKQIAMQHTA